MVSDDGEQWRAVKNFRADAPGQVVPETHVDIFAVTHATARQYERAWPVHLARPGCVAVRLTPVTGKALLIADKYRVIETIGRGGMGVVYKACQENLDRVVAVKLIPLVYSRSASGSGLAWIESSGAAPPFPVIN